MRVFVVYEDVDLGYYSESTAPGLTGGIPLAVFSSQVLAYIWITKHGMPAYSLSVDEVELDPKE